MNGSPTLAAGMFVADVKECFKTLGDVHAGLLTNRHASSWFIVQHIPGAEIRLRGRFSDGTGLVTEYRRSTGSDDLVSMIARRRGSYRRDFASSALARRWAGRLLPAATLTVTISAGASMELTGRAGIGSTNTERADRNSGRGTKVSTGSGLIVEEQHVVQRFVR